MQISVSDVSLRRNGKEIGSLGFKEKLGLFGSLTELNVNVIEVGPLFKDKADEVLVKTLCGIAKSSTVAAVVEGNEKDVERAYSLVSGAKKKRIIINLPVSPVRMEYSYGKKPQGVIELIKTLTEKAVSLCSDVEVSLCDATRAERKFLSDAVKTAIAAGAGTITLDDEAGLFYPQEYGEFIDDVYESVPELKNVKLCVSCSNALSFGAANMLTAIMKGASGVKLSAQGRYGLPTVESFAAIIDGVLAKKGYTIGIERTAMSRILKRIESLSASEIAEARERDVNTDTVGESLTQSALGKIVKKLGYDLSAEDLSAVYAEYKRISENKKVGVNEIEALIASSALQVPPTYTLEKFSVQCSNVMSATANIVVKKDGKEIKGLSFGNGAIDAAFFALENIVGRHFELDDFKIVSLTEGKEAVGETLVKLRFDGKIYSGRGLSTDIVGASIRAYINAVNKIVYEENNG